MADFKFKLLRELIKEGVDISNDPENCSYPRSSFKRTVSGIKNDYEKIIKKSDDAEKLKTKKIKLEEERKDIIEKQESEESLDKTKKSKYIKEYEKLEKEIEKLEKEIKKLEKEIDSLWDKLKGKMKKEAGEYLKNKKDFADNSKISVAKDPKELNKIKDSKNYMNGLLDSYNKICDKVKNELQPIAKSGYNYYCSELLKKYTKSSINLAVNEIKKTDLSNPNDIKNHFGKELINDILNPHFFSFVYAYIKLQISRKKFSEWFETEYKYLMGFENLNEIEMLKYNKHGAYIDIVASLKQDTKELNVALNKLYDFCRDNGLKKQLNHIHTKLTGYSQVSLALALSNSLLGIAVGPYLIFKGLKNYTNKKKPLYQNICNLINETNNGLDDLIDQKPGKNDLNVQKVAYMREVVKELQ